MACEQGLGETGTGMVDSQYQRLDKLNKGLEMSVGLAWDRSAWQQ